MDKNKQYFEIFNKHLMEDKKPSKYFENLIDKNEFPDWKPFNMLIKLKEIEQSHKYHPEGSVWNHTMLVVDEVASVRGLSENSCILMWTALLHDLGKITTTKVRKGRITAYNHDKEGAVFAKEFLEECTEDKELIDKVSKYVYWHMQPLYVYKNLPFANIGEMQKQVSPSEVALLSLCDRKGRGELNTCKEKEETKNIIYFMDKCEEIIIDKEKRRKIEKLKNKLLKIVH